MRSIESIGLASLATYSRQTPALSDGDFEVNPKNKLSLKLGDAVDQGWIRDDQGTQSVVTVLTCL